MKKITLLIFVWMLLFSIGISAQTYDLLALTPTEFQAGGNTQWSFEKYNLSTGVYSTFTQFGDSGRINFRDIYNPERYQGVLIGEPDPSQSALYSTKKNSWFNNKNEYLYIGENYEVYCLYSSNPAIVFTAPADGYYKVNATVLREDGWKTPNLNAVFRYRYNGETTLDNQASIGYNFPFGAGGLNTNSTLLDESGIMLKSIIQQPASTSFYIYAKAGSKITFEIDCKNYPEAATVVREAWARTKWTALNLQVVTEAEAKASSNFADPYSTGWEAGFWAKYGEANDVLNLATTGTEVGQYPATAKSTFESVLTAAEAAFNAGQINSFNAVAWITKMEQSIVTFKSKVNKIDWSQSYNYKLFPIDEANSEEVTKLFNTVSLNVSTPWNFKRYTVSNGTYANFTTWGTGGKFSTGGGNPWGSFTTLYSWYNATGDWLFLGQNGWMHPTTAVSPTITFTAPANGIYKVGATVLRQPHTRTKTLWARFRYMPVGTTTCSKSNFIFAKEFGGNSSSKPIDADFYINLKTGDVLTFEEDCYTANENSSAGMQWSRLGIATMQGAEVDIKAAIALDTLTFIDPYKPGNFSALQTLLNTCNTFLNAAPLDSALGKYPTSAATKFSLVTTSTQSMITAATAGQPAIDVQISTLNDAFTVFKNSLVTDLNKISDGIYNIKISDGNGDYLYLTDWKLVSPASAAATDTIFPIFLPEDKINPKVQSWQITKDANVNRIRIDSKYRLDNVANFPRTYLTEAAKFPLNAYNSAWNTYNFYFDGIKYAIQRAGSAGSTFFYPANFTYLTTTGKRIMYDAATSKFDNLHFIIEPVLASATQAEKDALILKISEATSIYNLSVEGLELGRYTADIRTTFKQVFDSGTALLSGSPTGNAVIGKTNEITTAISTFKNSINKETNTLTQGDYYIKTTNASNETLYLTDNKLMAVPTVTSDTIFPVFQPKAIQNADPQLWKISMDMSVNRLRIDSKARLSDNVTFPATKTYLGEKGRFGFNDYSAQWNTYNIFYNGAKYAIQLAGSGGNTFFAVGDYTLGTTSGVRLYGTATGYIADNFTIDLELVNNTVLDKTNNFDVKVYGLSNQIVVKEAQIGSVLEVYNIVGHLINRTKINSNVQSIENIDSGVYIVKLSGLNHGITKVIVR